jgi:hypothetical protein
VGAGWQRSLLLVGQQDLPPPGDDVSGFQMGNPEEIITGVLPIATGGLYDLAPNGNRFVVAKADEAPFVPQYRLVVNWIEEVKARAGQRR